MTTLNISYQADFVIVLYNPKSKGRPKHIEKAIRILLKYKDSATPVAIVKNSGRAGMEVQLVTLATIDYEFVDMKTVVIIGNKTTYIKNRTMITPRGYLLGS